jgi:hypothetical protein
MCQNASSIHTVLVLVCLLYSSIPHCTTFAITHLISDYLACRWGLLHCLLACSELCDLCEDSILPSMSRLYAFLYLGNLSTKCFVLVEFPNCRLTPKLFRSPTILHLKNGFQTEKINAGFLCFLALRMACRLLSLRFWDSQDHVQSCSTGEVLHQGSQPLVGAPRRTCCSVRKQR